MTDLEHKLRSLSGIAARFVTKSGLPIPTFVSLPDWPDDAAFPVQRVLEDPTRLLVQPSAYLRAIALRNRYDPDEQSPWMFVPSPDNSEVWLIRTRQIDPSLN